MRFMEHRNLIALSDSLIEAAGAVESLAVLIAQYDIQRLQHVFHWSHQDRSIGFRLDTLPPSKREMEELMRTWREAPLDPGSTADTEEKSRQTYGVVVIRANMPAVQA